MLVCSANYLMEKVGYVFSSLARQSDMIKKKSPSPNILDQNKAQRQEIVTWSSL